MREGGIRNKTLPEPIPDTLCADQMLDFMRSLSQGEKDGAKVSPHLSSLNRLGNLSPGPSLRIRRTPSDSEAKLRESSPIRFIFEKIPNDKDEKEEEKRSG